MARHGLRHFAAILRDEREANAERYVDMMIVLRVADFVRDESGEATMIAGTEEPIAEVGGIWDRQRKRWLLDREPDKYQVCYIPRGSDQEAPARWLARWLAMYARGRRGKHWLTEGRRIFSLLLLGGRRGGKSHLAVIALAMFCVMIPNSITWAISPTIDETTELLDALKSILPTRWYRIKQAPGIKADQFHFINRSKLLMLSGNKANSLKRGRVDMALYNEGQKMRKKGWTQIRGAISDRGGLCLIAANPPDEEVGRWIEDLSTDIASGKVAAAQFLITAKRNPFVDLAALEEMRNEMSQSEGEREIDGLIKPIGDVVFHEFAPGNVQWVPDHFVDITDQFLRDKLGRRAGYVGGMDFQQDPHMACAIEKIFIDPADPKREPLLFVVDECIVEQSNEEELIDALEGKAAWSMAYQAMLRAHIDKGASVGAIEALRFDGPCYTGAAGDPEHVAIVADASGWWQDGAHNKGKQSDRRLIAAGWNDLHRPQKESRANPRIVERVKIINRLLLNNKQVIRLFVTPNCTAVINAMRKWSRKNHIPNRNAIQAHVCDAVTYPAYRLFAAPILPKKPSTYQRINQFKRERLQ